MHIHIILCTWLVLAMSCMINCHVTPANKDPKLPFPSEQNFQISTDKKGRSIHLLNLLLAKVELIHNLKHQIKQKILEKWVSKITTKSPTTTTTEKTTNMTTTAKPPTTTKKAKMTTTAKPSTTTKKAKMTATAKPPTTTKKAKMTTTAKPSTTTTKKATTKTTTTAKPSTTTTKKATTKTTTTAKPSTTTTKKATTKTTTTATNRTEPQPCYSQNNLLLMIDSSGSIRPQNYKPVLEFSARLAVCWKEFALNGIAASLFSSSVKGVLTFDDGKRLNKKEINKQILEAPYLEGGTATHLALDAARVQLVQSTNSKAVPLNLVLLTDGYSGMSSETKEAAKRLYATGIRVFSVGVGSGVNQNELLQIAGNDLNRVFNANGFHDLLLLLKPVSERICM